MLRVVTDVHQHLWSEALVEALERRAELPFVRREHGLAVVYLRGERPYAIEPAAQDPVCRTALLDIDGVERALLCISSPLGIESLPRAHARPLLDAYHDGALALGDPFGVWGAVALDDPEPDDVDAVLARGCIGVSLPAGALADVRAVARMRPLLARLEHRHAPLFVHPGPAPGAALEDPLWWPALTSYVAGLQQAWLAFMAAGRAEHPRLRVIFAALAGLAPLQRERLRTRGGPAGAGRDALTFYDTASYGADAVAAVAAVVGAEQIVYGSDRPVLEPSAAELARHLDWELVARAQRRALAPNPVAVTT